MKLESRNLPSVAATPGPRVRQFLGGLATALLFVAVGTPATAQLDDSIYAAIEDVVITYAADMNRAAPCLYIAGHTIMPSGEDRFDSGWGETAVTEAIEDIDDISRDQAEALLALFRDTFSPDYLVEDVRELALRCYLSETDDRPIVTQFLMFTGVGIPFDVRIDRALD